MLPEEIEKLKSMQSEFVNYLLKLLEETREDISIHTSLIVESEDEQDKKAFMTERTRHNGAYVRTMRILRHILKNGLS